MSVCKFKLGDRVRVTRATEFAIWFEIGDVGTVCEIPKWYGGTAIMVKFDTPRHGDGRWYVAEKNLEEETK